TANDVGIEIKPTDAEVDSFYKRILEGVEYVEWDVDLQYLPTIYDLGAYSTIIWHADDIYLDQLLSVKDMLYYYLETGGSLWITGWRTFIPLEGKLPQKFDSGDFEYDYLHYKKIEEKRAIDFKGAAGLFGYPNVSVDSEKVFQNWKGRLRYVPHLDPVEAEPIYLFQSFSGDTSFSNKPVALRYIGENYRVILFGFPLYFMKEDQAKYIASKVLTDLGVLTGIALDENGKRLPVEFQLFQNYPNPFNSRTVIRYRIPRRTKVKFTIFNIRGEEVVELVNTVLERGEHRTLWDGKDRYRKYVSSGVYLYRLTAGNSIKTGKMVILR
ncbi:MAG: T9SS type A sorting domain-containing protein, partial [Fidelibacterota bacterium]